MALPNMKSIHQDRYAVFIDKIIATRKAQSLTQSQIAQKLNKPQSFIAKIEGKDRKLDVLEFIDICHALSISPSSFIHECFETE